MFPVFLFWVVCDGTGQERSGLVCGSPSQVMCLVLVMLPFLARQWNNN